MKPKTKITIAVLTILIGTITAFGVPYVNRVDNDASCVYQATELVKSARVLGNHSSYEDALLELTKAYDIVQSIRSEGKRANIRSSVLAHQAFYELQLARNNYSEENVNKAILAAQYALSCIAPDKQPVVFGAVLFYKATAYHLRFWHNNKTDDCDEALALYTECLKYIPKEDPMYLQALDGIETLEAK